MGAMDDPNRDRNDPMVPEYWSLGEAIQDQVRLGGYDHPEVEGIAVDLHDILQAADSIRAIQPSSDLAELRFELEHIRWHCERAIAFLAASDANVR
jgi:hypothetical protein